jgi:hypothetical protein
MRSRWTYAIGVRPVALANIISSTGLAIEPFAAGQSGPSGERFLRRALASIC